MRKIKAFSLVEIIIVMLLSAITIGFAYYIFQKVNKYMYTFNGMTQRNDDLTEWFNYIKLQTLKADELYFQQNHIVFRQADNQEIELMLFKEGLSRKAQNYQDTLIVNSPVIHTKEENGYISFFIQFIIEGETIEWNFMKQKDLANLYASDRN